MNKLLFSTFLLFSIVATSCVPRTPKDKQEVDAKGTETVIEKPIYKADIRKALEGDFDRQKEGNLEQVTPKHVAKDGQGIYCYFFLRNDKAISLKLHIQYSDYDADLFEIDADGEVMAFETNKTHTSASGMVIAEGATFRWYDKGINEADEEFIRSIENAESVVLKFKVKKGDRLLGSTILAKKEVQSLVNTIDYYKALDGAKIPKKGMVNIRG